MAASVLLNSENYSNYNYIIPYVRHCWEDKYNSPWELKSRKIGDYEFLLITEGTGQFVIEDNNNKDKKIFNVKKNDLILFKPNLYHYGGSISLPFKFLCIHFDLFVSRSINDLHIEQRNIYEGVPVRPIKYRKACLDFPEYMHISDSSYVQMLLKKIKNELEFKSEAYNIIIKSLFVDFIISLFRQIGGNKNSKTNSPEIQQAIEFIKQNYMNKISLSELAANIHLQSTYLSSLFKKQTGYTVTQFIKLYRVVIAKKLLLESDKKIEEIAESIGFYDHHHFSRVFKENEGLTPAQYRLYKVTHSRD